MKYFIALLIFTLIFQGNSYAWYGAGNSEGWPNTLNGATAIVESPFYKTPPASYKAGDTITIDFTVKNPANNSRIFEELALEIWKVESISPLLERSEQTLYETHNSGLDTQSPFTKIPVGQLSLAPDESATFTVEFNISEAGYYQFDLTDLTIGEEYGPGRIYAAGFLRVLPKDTLIQSATADNSVKPQYLFAAGLVTLLLSLLLAYLLKRRTKKPEFTIDKL